MKHVVVPVAKPKLTRAETRVIVLNGNGRQGAAAQGAARLRSFGYAIAGTENARRQDYAATVVMYRAGFRAEGLRLAKDLKVKVVGPLDGLAPSALRGGQLAIVIGAVVLSRRRCRSSRASARGRTPCSPGPAG